MAAPPASPAESDSLMGFPDELTSPTPASTCLSDPLPSMMRDPDLRALLQALPMRSDMEALVLSLEIAHHRDLSSKQTCSCFLTGSPRAKTSLSSLENRVSQLEQTQSLQASHVTTLHMEELEDWSRCNNLRLRGIPEATGQESL